MYFFSFDATSILMVNEDVYIKQFFRMQPVRCIAATGGMRS